MGWGDEIKGIKAGAKASVASGAIAFSIGDVDITLTGDFITAGIGGEITSKGIKFNYGLGWAGGGISIGW